MSEPVEEKEFNFPIEIKNIVSPLRNEKHWKILELLLNHDNRLTYTEIRKKLQMSEKQKGTLNYHLNELEKGGWLRNYTEAGIDVTDRYSSYYTVTKFGQKVLDGIMQAMNKSVYPNSLLEYAQFTTNTASLLIKEKSKKQAVPENTTIVSNAEREDILTTLSYFGLEKIDAVVYLGLLQTSATTVGTLTAKLNIDRGKTYRALNKLRNLGLITTTFANPTICKAVEPKEAISHIIEISDNQTQTMKDASMRVIKNLEKISKTANVAENKKSREVSSFTIIQGRANIYAQIGKLIQNSTKTVYIVTTVEDILRMYHTSIPEKIKKHERENGEIRILTETDNPELLPLINRLNATEVRIGKLPSKTRMIVEENSHVIMSGSIKQSIDLNDSSDSILYTDSPEMVNNMYSLCTFLWSKAKPIKILVESRPDWSRTVKEMIQNITQTEIPTSTTQHVTPIANKKLGTLDSGSQMHEPTDRNFRRVFVELDELKNRLGINDVVMEKAMYVYLKAQESGLVQGRSISALIAASLYAACRDTETPRTLNDIGNASGVKRKDIARHYRLLLRELNLKMPIVDPTKLVTRIASRAELSEEIQREAIKILKTAKENNISAGKNPMGIAAAALYVACITKGENKTQREVAEAAGLTEMILRNEYKGLKSTLNR